MNTSDRPRRLYRSRSDRLIAGVCGGIAEYFGWDPTLVRLVFVALLFLPIPGPQALLYLVAWIVIPYEP
ncbi:MAG TPA: PspC domain-containing protein [Actinomycetes bacterium]|nr:PspC domain-containing protein [Actinomycetes bacterium]